MKKLFRFIFKRRLMRWSAIGALLIVATIYFSNLWIEHKSEGRVYTAVTEIPENPVGLVLGASRLTTRGNINLYFKYRIDAAAKLYHAGKIKHILVSGDNHRKGYDEPTDMLEALIKKGVPESAITLDYAGFRTLDSVVRCKKIFGQDNVTIISQPFHNERALFLCDYYDMDAVAFAAKDVPKKYSVKTGVREYFARVKAVLDLYILRKSPKFLGKQEYIAVK